MTTIYGDLIGGNLFTNVKAALYELYDDYVNDDKSINDYGSGNNALTVIGGGSQSTYVFDVQSSGQSFSVLKARFKQQKLEARLGGSKLSELDSYLSESCIEIVEVEKFNILKLFKLNAERFLVLSKMARDLLAIPISTIASESAFSTSGRVLDAFKSSLIQKIIETLICVQDWIKNSNISLSVEENIAELEEFEKGQSHKHFTASISLSFLNFDSIFFSDPLLLFLGKLPSNWHSFCSHFNY